MYQQKEKKWKRVTKMNISLLFRKEDKEEVMLLLFPSVFFHHSKYTLYIQHTI